MIKPIDLVIHRTLEVSIWGSEWRGRVAYMERTAGRKFKLTFAGNVDGGVHRTRWDAMQAIVERVNSRGPFYEPRVPAGHLPSDRRSDA